MKSLHPLLLCLWLSILVSIGDPIHVHAMRPGNEKSIFLHQILKTRGNLEGWSASPGHTSRDSRLWTSRGSTHGDLTDLQMEYTAKVMLAKVVLEKTSKLPMEKRGECIVYSDAI